MPRINLYSGVQKQKKIVVDIVGFFGSFNLILTFVFFITFAVLVFIIIFNQNSIKLAKAEEENYKKKLKELEQIEMQYAFLKDRAAKASEVFKSKVVVNKMEELDSILQRIGGVILDEALLDSKKTWLSVSVYSFSELRNFLSELKSLDSYQKGAISSLNFNPEKGYTLELKFE